MNSTKGTFAPFPIESKGAVKKDILFRCVAHNQNPPFPKWKEGNYEFELYITTTEENKPYKAVSLKHKIFSPTIANIYNGGNFTQQTSPQPLTEEK